MSAFSSYKIILVYLVLTTLVHGMYAPPTEPAEPDNIQSTCSKGRWWFSTCEGSCSPAGDYVCKEVDGVCGCWETKEKKQRDEAERQRNREANIWRVFDRIQCSTNTDVNCSPDRICRNLHTGEWTTPGFSTCSIQQTCAINGQRSSRVTQQGALDVENVVPSSSSRSLATNPYQTAGVPNDSGYDGNHPFPQTDRDEIRRQLGESDSCDLCAQIHPNPITNEPGQCVGKGACLLIEENPEEPFNCEIDPSYFTSKDICLGDDGIWCEPCAGRRKLSGQASRLLLL